MSKAKHDKVRVKAVHYQSCKVISLMKYHINSLESRIFFLRSEIKEEKNDFHPH